MDNGIKEVVLFVISFVIVFIMYQVFVIRKAKVRKKGKKEAREPFEVTYLVGRYNLDLEKVNYKNLLRVIAFVSSFDIALVVSIILLLKNFILEIVVGFISTLIIILISYHIVYLVYKKKGMIKNERKRNRK